MWDMGKKGEQGDAGEDDGDYNIRKMWNRLLVEEPSAVADAQIFEYKSTIDGKTQSIKQSSLTQRTTPG